MRILITGASGMLAADLIRAGKRAGHDLLTANHAELDICRADQVEAAFDRLVAGASEGEPAAVINCAAFTDVDGAQSERERAFAVNAQGPALLAQCAAQRSLPLVHISSDYVFGGGQLEGAGAHAPGNPYRESDPPAPSGVYGQSKRAGEEAVLEAGPLHTVVRSSWLFGLGGRNFVATMLRLGAERGAVAVVDDQIGSPTWTGHLAPALIGLLERSVSGIVHLAGGGEVSWWGFAKEIFRQAEVPCSVSAISTAQSGRPAPRPAYSALASERSDVIPLPPWQDGLAGYLAAKAGIMRT
jgi:dTDP-4-dehydrorhamnose reductase